MSRTVDLLKIYQESPELIKILKETKGNVSLFCYDKGIQEQWKSFVEKINKSKNITKPSELFRGVTIPRLKILYALVAQKEGMENFNPRPQNTMKVVNNYDMPLRFKNKFSKLLVDGFWFLGTVIENSLSDDVSINGGNPFDFLPGDLGYWWAGVVILDWYQAFHSCHYRRLDIKYQPLRGNSKLIPIKNATAFYDDYCINNKHKYSQRSALSHMGRIPKQFLSDEDMDNFVTTLNKFDESYQKEDLRVMKEIEARLKLL